MKIAFFGTPEIAVAPLQALISDPTIEVVAVFTQPDRPTGRKQILTPSAVKIAAKDFPIFQPENKKQLEVMTKDLQVDLFVVIAFGMIFSETVLATPKIACINVHMSALPKYRGASPIQQSLLNGDQETAISIMQMAKGLDSGPIYQTLPVTIEADDNYPTLSEKLAHKTAAILPETLKEIANGNLTAKDQDHNLASHCQKISKQDGQIQANHSAEQILNMIRAFTPWPEVFTKFNEKKLTILHAEISETNLPPQKFQIIDQKLFLGTSTKALIIEDLKPEGKNTMKAKDFLNGLPRDMLKKDEM